MATALEIAALVAVPAALAIDLGPLIRPLGVIVVLSLLARAAPEFWRLYRHRRAGLAEVDRMPGREFEHYLGLLFERLGHKVEVTKAHGDFGADLVVRKDDKRLLVQAKRWSKPIGIKAVQEAAAAVPYYKVDSALVVANRSFTQAARRLAQANRVELWDRDRLAGKIVEARLGRDGQPSVTAPSEEGGPGGWQPTPAAPTCQRCGSAMVLRTGPRGRFYGCSTFPRCRFTAPARGEA